MDLLILSASAKAWRQRQIKAGVFIQGSTVLFKSWSLKSWGHMTFNSDMWISLILNIANNAEIDSCLQHLHIRQLSLNRDEWWNYRTSKPSKLVTVKGCRKHDIMTCRSIQRFCGARHTPGLGALSANLTRMQIDVSDGLVDFKCLGQGLEAATDQGWRLARGPFGQNLISEMLKQKGIQLWHVESLWFKTWRDSNDNGKILQTSTGSFRSFSNIQHPHIYSWIGSIWQLNSIRDERWNYRTSKPSKLLTVRGCREHDIMTCRSIQRFCGARHSPGLGALSANLVSKRDVRDGPVYLQCLRQALEAATDQGFQSKGSVNRNLAIAF